MLTVPDCRRWDRLPFHDPAGIPRYWKEVAVALDDEALAPVALDCQSRTTGGTPASVRLWERCAPKRWGRVNVMGEVGV